MILEVSSGAFSGAPSEEAALLDDMIELTADDGRDDEREVDEDHVKEDGETEQRTVNRSWSFLGIEADLAVTFCLRRHGRSRTYKTRRNGVWCYREHDGDGPDMYIYIYIIYI